ncbi:hypothetical protein AVEN_61442-1 [Araneus ventricosus]|uniref:Uncharacterized protein n=1 Tax=Araneus ventricosus TaxID=182803 RepID=A0A4Y2KF47_ARAVE|nr:hypothetical protein AVEN_61442-1 [Araneus ventricosus]
MFIEWSRNSDPKTTPDLVAPSPELNAANQILFVSFSAKTEDILLFYWYVFSQWTCHPSPISFGTSEVKYENQDIVRSSSKDLLYPLVTDD